MSRRGVPMAWPVQTPSPGINTHERRVIPKGTDVVDVDGDKVGTVKGACHPAGDFAAGVGHHDVLLDPGLRDWFGGYDEVYLPESAICFVTSERVDLGLTKDQIKGETGRSAPPTWTATAGSSARHEASEVSCQKEGSMYIGGGAILLILIILLLILVF